MIIDQAGGKIMDPTKTANKTTPMRYESHIHIVKTDEGYYGRPILKNTLYDMRTGKEMENK